MYISGTGNVMPELFPSLESVILVLLVVIPEK